MAGIVLVLDGLGDRVHRERGKTPLEEANTPHLDRLAREGVSGEYWSVDYWVAPGSTAAMLGILGYDPVADNPGRGVLAAIGEGIYVDGAVAARANLCTVKDGKVVDRRAGRINDLDLLREIEGVLNGIEVPGARITFKHTMEHRGVVVLASESFEPSPALLSNDPEDAHYSGTLHVRASNKSAEQTAVALNKWLDEAHARLSKIPGNRERELPANYVLLRGFGKLGKQPPPFSEKHGIDGVVVSGVPYLKGIARYLGMELCVVDEEDVNRNVKQVGDEITKYAGEDVLVFTHVKATDVPGHDGDFEGKVRALEKVDAELVRRILDVIDPAEDVLVVTGDHATPVTEKKHTADPCPLVVWGRGVVPDGTRAFTEREVRGGGLGKMKGAELMRYVLNALGKIRRVGA